MSRFRSIFAFLILFTFEDSYAAKFVAEPATSKVHFLAVGRPSLIHINGESSGLTGACEVSDTSVTGSFNLVLKDLKTGNDMRDEHMTEKYLEIDKFPAALITIDGLKISTSQKGDDLPFSGRLKLHGQEKPVSGKFSFSTSGKSKSVNAVFKITLSDFAIAIPEYAGIKVADTVTIDIQTTLKPE